MSTAVWTVERTTDARFPFRIAVEQHGRTLFAVRARAAWPGPGQNIFCLRERAHDPTESLEVVERVPVASLTTIGRKLTLALDRPQRKRCEFLTVEKPRADGRGSYEQVFFRAKRKLPIGDYALLDGERIAAVVERKSYDNLLSDIGAVQALHQQLADLGACDASAVVIEADYRDFLDPSRLNGRWPATHVAPPHAPTAPRASARS